MIQFVYVMVLGLVFVSCEKFDDLEPLTNTSPNNSMLGAQCKGDISKETRYRTRVFFEGFDDAIPGDPCYTSAPSCIGYLEWGMPMECPKDQDFSGIRNLNKCIWHVWTGWNFWSSKNNEGRTTFSADAVSVKDGMAIFSVKPNPNYVAGKGGCRSGAGPAGTASYHERNCPLIVGGIDSRYIDPQHPGKSARFGRIEIKAKFVRGSSALASFPALWMWPESGDRAQSLKPKNTPIGEIDILEYDDATSKDVPLQSYHNWWENKGHGWITKSWLAEQTGWHRYGVEWSSTRLRFYIDDCITYDINEGDLATAGDRKHPMSISDAASFLMLELNTSFDLSSINVKANDQLLVDEVSVFE